MAIDELTPDSLKLIIFDRDGVLVPLRWCQGRYVSFHNLHADDFSAELAACLGNLKHLKKALATNQPDVARGLISIEQVEKDNEYVRQYYSLDYVFVCPHDNSDFCACRKPAPGLLLKALQAANVTASEAVFIGDRSSDLEAAKRAGVRAIFLDNGSSQIDARNKPAVLLRGVEGLLQWLRTSKDLMEKEENAIS